MEYPGFINDVGTQDPKESFYMLFRMYQPDIEVLNGQYELPGGENISPRDSSGMPIDARYAKLRAKNEIATEILQTKGSPIPTRRCHPMMNSPVLKSNIAT